MVFKYLAFNVNYGRGIMISPQPMTTTVDKQKEKYYCIFCSKQIKLLVERMKERFT
jgi:hypothetical protein